MKKTGIAAVIALSLAAGSASAEVKFNGFASIKAGMTSADDENLYGYENASVRRL